LGSAGTERRQAYRALFSAHADEALIEEIRSATNGNYALGRECFQKQIEVALGRRAVRGTAGRPPKAALADDGQRRLL
jgi:putative transposase